MTRREGVALGVVLLVALAVRVTALFHTFGLSATVARAGNVVLGAALVLPIFALGRTLGGARVGLLAAAIAALYPNFVAFSHYLWTETLYSLLICTGLALLASSAARRALWKSLTAGALFGAAALTREVGAVFPLFAACWLLWLERSAWRRGLLHAGSFVVVVVLVALPWTLYINGRGEAFALLGRTTGMNLYVGNAAPFVPEPGAAPVPPEEHFYELGSNLYERERVAAELAWMAIRERMPAWPFEKLASELPRTFTPTSFAVRRLLVEPRPLPESLDGTWAYRTRWTALDARPVRIAAAVTVVGSYVVVAILGAGGLVLAQRRALAALFGLFVASQLLPVVLSFGLSRFRLPSMALFVVGAASLVVCGRSDWGAASRARRGAAIVAMGVMVVVIASRWGAALDPARG